MAMIKQQLFSFADANTLAQAATTAILTAATEAIAKKGAFKIVLAGGSTPNLIYQNLSQVQTDWNNWWIFWGDERCLPAQDNERNSLMAKQAWLDKVSIPGAQIFPIPAEQGAKSAAATYQSIIAKYLPFDMVLLGMGEDGHTASLFPGQVHNQSELVHEVYNSPKPPSDRVSMSAKALSDTTQLLFLISGAGKREAFKAWQQGADLPVAQIKPENGIEIYADQAVLES
jgi:6-phosphogluconolactonase